MNIKITFGKSLPNPIKTVRGWHVPIGIEQVTTTDPEGLEATVYEAYEVISPTLLTHDIEQAVVKVGLDPTLFAADIESAVEFGTPEDWRGFNADMILNVERNAYDLAIKDTHPTLSSKLDLAYSVVARDGSEDFRTVYQIYCDTAAVTQTDKTAWANLARARHLPREFVNILENN